MKNSTGGLNSQGGAASIFASGTGCTKRKVVAILVILLVLMLLIGIYGMTIMTFFPKKMVYKDFMNYKIFTLPGSNCCSLWPISHLVLYLILGFIFPDCWLLLFIVGALWEAMEVVGGKIPILNPQRKFKEGYGDDPDVEYSNGWWAGSFKDVIFNTIGLAMGVLLRKAWDALRKEKTNK